MATPIRFKSSTSRLSIPTLAFSVALVLATTPRASAGLLAVTPPGSLPARGGQVQVPESSLEDPRDIGFRAHTNVRVMVPTGGMDFVAPPSHAAVTKGVQLQPQASAPYSGYYFLETPASLACVYKLVAQVAGCNPYGTTALPTGGSRAIAIVDAYDDPTAAADLAHFSAQFGLPAANFQVVYASGKRPSPDSGWALEASLDIEWAHAMAPNARIYLVEAASNSFSSLFSAVTVASNLVAAAGGGEVSMSWGASEFSGETAFDGYFTTPKVVYVASSGDSAGVIYPSASPNVVSVGGTTLSRNPGTGNFQKELSWQQTGGGPSAYEALPAYQAGLRGTLGAHRGTPDVAAIADPTTGVWVYAGGYWYIVGGTSVAAPVTAGIINLAGSFRTSTAAELAAIYGNASGFTNIVDGACGPYEGYIAGAGWNFCTGIGSPFGAANK
jgi:kumamolisin